MRSSSFATEIDVEFLDPARPPLGRDDGRLAGNMSTDDWHLSPDGYEILARWLRESGGAFAQILD